MKSPSRSRRPVRRRRPAAAPAARPVPEAIELRPEDFAIRRILVPVDFSAFARRAVRHAIPFANAFGARLLLLHVAPEGTAAATAAAGRRLARLARQQVPAEIPADTLVRCGDAFAEIVTAAIAEHDVDLVVVTPHHPVRLPCSPRGRMAERLALEAPCPVLVARG